MVKIISIAENYEWTSLINKIIVTPDSKVSWVSNESRLYETIQSVQPNIVFIPSSKSYDVYTVSNKVSTAFPTLTILLGFQSETELDMKRALRAGASDVVFLSAPLSKIKEDLDFAIKKSSGRSIQKQEVEVNTKKDGRVITVCSTKGGIGKTTIAVNLAAVYGKKLAKVAVVDLDLQFGDVAMYFDVKPKETIYDWVKKDAERNQIAHYMTTLTENISILAAPQRPEFSEVITGDDVRQAIHKLKQQFDLIIVDVSSHMNEIAIVALENSNDILIMTYLDLPTLRNSKILIDTLASLHLGDRIKVVLNRHMKVKGLNTETVEKVIGEKVFSAIPVMDKAMVLAVNEGRPVVYSNPRSPVAKKLVQMAETLYHPGSKTIVKKRKDKHKVPIGGTV